mgnify:CR=1 FL=1
MLAAVISCINLRIINNEQRRTSNRNIYPKKGAIQVGSDADITIVDLNRKSVIDESKAFAKAGWSSFDGYDVIGVPTQTIVRGTVVYDEGEITADPGYGKYVDKNEYFR